MRDARRRLDHDPIPHRAIDWWETGGIVRWPDPLPARWDHYRRLRALAREKREPQRSPELGATWNVQGMGAGGGRDSHCELRLETGPGGDSIVLHLDPRASSDRTLYNMRRRVTGDACVIHGVRFALSIQNHLIEALGGVVVDEWVKRVDLCGDFYGRDMGRDVLEPFEAGRFVSSAKKRARFSEGDAPTGLKIGSGERLMLTIYDKRHELTRKSLDYRFCVLRDRYHEHPETPLEHLEPAVRAEYRLMGAWLTDHGYRTALGVLDNLPNIARKISGGDDGRTFFMLTDGMPDKGNGHQSRAEPSDFWRRVLTTFDGWDERTAFAPVKPVDRSLIRPEKAARTMASYAAGIAVDCGAPVSTVPELLSFLSANAARLGLKDAGVRELVARHRKKRGLPAAA
ncbi:hypothetical protein [Alienimonas chondri]|nr:hypothetical protein [Alienimonas chondri]